MSDIVGRLNDLQQQMAIEPFNAHLAAALRDAMEEIQRLRRLDVQFGKVEAWIATRTDFSSPPHEKEQGAEGMIAALDRMKTQRDKLHETVRRIGLPGKQIAYCWDGHEQSVLIARDALEKLGSAGSAEVKTTADANAGKEADEIERLRTAHAENARLLNLVINDLMGRVEAGKLRALMQCADRSIAVLEDADEPRYR